MSNPTSKFQELDDGLIGELSSQVDALGASPEGVDEETTCRILCDHGCDLAQGYYFSRPVPAAELEKWLQETQLGLQLASWLTR